MPNPQKMGTLRFREVGEEWVASYMMSRDLTYAYRLGSINLTLIDGTSQAHQRRKKLFVELMMVAVEDLIREAVTAKVVWTLTKQIGHER